MQDIIIAQNEKKGASIISRLVEKNPLFCCVIGITETAKIQGISAAGENPEFTDYTPPADVELLHLGKCKCIPGVPITPDGIPTPALITMSALKLADIPTFVVNSGLRIKPQIPFIDLGGFPGKDIRTGKALKNAQEVMDRAKILGKNLSKTTDYIVLGESIPGGTTTALSLLLALGVDAKGRVSSSMLSNPHELKIRIAIEALKASGIRPGKYKNNPIEAVSRVGDPMQPALAGLVIGAAKRIPVILAGGTQMAAVLALVNSLNQDILDNLIIGTTRWILNDRNSDINYLISNIADVPVLASDLNFSKSKYNGLKAYEAGVVKEGVGCGGASIAAILKSNGRISKISLQKEIEKNYAKLVS